MELMNPIELLHLLRDRLTIVRRRIDTATGAELATLQGEQLWLAGMIKVVMAAECMTCEVDA